MKHIVVYVHGKGGSPAEAEHYKSLFPDSEVIGFDYRAQTPWEAKEEFPPFFAALRQRCGSLTLIANSIGAFFSLSALDETPVDTAYLISPVADVEKLIRSMMAGADVTEQELAEKQEIPTPFAKRCHGGIYAMCASIRFRGASRPVFCMERGITCPIWKLYRILQENFAQS